MRSFLGFCAEMPALKLDTFISQSEPSKAFENEKFLSVSNAKDSAKIAYIPFRCDPILYAFNPQKDTVFLSKLILHIKANPVFIEKVNKLIKTANKNTEQASEDEIAKIREAKDALNIKIAVFAIVNESAFFDINDTYKVSWNGENEKIAPAHDTNSTALDTTAAFRLGTLQLNLKEPVKDGDKLEFTSENFADYINYALAAKSEKNKPLPFPRFCQQLDIATLVLVQEGGITPLLFYSTNSFDDENDGFANKPDLRPKLLLEFSAKSENSGS
ncbi:MAG: hypothetical protein SPI34_00690 [Opitutales bacterium]|nr:hypothetical protein [Opitutales bacterium]